ncbi:kinase-like domain-containing protein [Cytidiella melzeri]|nr:kinase-like domain-containing protein [Cytidiella melzeri]
MVYSPPPGKIVSSTSDTFDKEGSRAYTSTSRGTSQRSATHSHKSSKLTTSHPFVFRLLSRLPSVTPTRGQQEIEKWWTKTFKQWEVNDVLDLTDNEGNKIVLSHLQSECVFTLAALKVLLHPTHPKHFTMWGKDWAQKTAEREKTCPAEINVIVSHPAAKPKPVADTEDLVKHQSAPTTTSTTSSDFSGKAVDDFEVIRLLGQGDKSKVFLALNTQTEQFDALKITPKAGLSAGLSAANRSCISNEHCFGKLLVDCPWAVGFKDSFEDSKNFYTVTDYCSGNSLRQQLVNFGLLTKSAARLVAAELIVSVESLHKCGIVHGDIKLNNILINEDSHLVFTGFGRTVTSQEHAWGQQQPSRPPSYKEDIYSMGLVIRHLLCPQLAASAIQVSQSAHDDLSQQSPMLETCSRQCTFFSQLKAHRFFGGDNWDSISARLDTNLHRKVFRYLPEFINMWDVPSAGEPIAQLSASSPTSHTSSVCNLPEQVQPKQKDQPQIVKLTPYNPLTLPKFNNSSCSLSSSAPPSLFSSTSVSSFYSFSLFLLSTSLLCTQDVASYKFFDINITDISPSVAFTEEGKEARYPRTDIGLRGSSSGSTPTAWAVARGTTSAQDTHSSSAPSAPGKSPLARIMSLGACTHKIRSLWSRVYRTFTSSLWT